MRSKRYYIVGGDKRLGFQGALVGLFLIFASLFVALELGAFDPIYELFR